MSANGDSTGEADAASAVKVPNSPSTAFAALSLCDQPSSSSSPQCSTSSAPFTPAHIKEIASSTALVAQLDAARKRPKPLIRSTGHIVERTDSHVNSNDADHHHLLSWKVAEFAYRKTTSIGSELPTLARGLFTERIGCSSAAEKHRIVVRGYDKFFNLGEMAWTKPESISRYTTAPYVLTFKENGCIIFVSALSPDELVVTSKHSLGSIEGADITHAQKGHEWLLYHLASVKRTEQQLAHELWRRNETAAFELCDDSFEEHVLAYSAARSGLHLHGLNANSPEFRTRTMPEVDEFANEWGFIPTRWLQLDSLDQVQSVTSRIEQTGAWEGEPIEGFVIRTHMPDAKAMQSLAETNVVSPPYAPGQAWFYKVKFDEPYLMYRDWRELARKMVKDKAEWETKVASLPAACTGHDSLDEAAPSLTIVQAESSASIPDNNVAHLGDADDSDAKGSSKAAIKRARKRLAKQTAKQAAAHRTAAQAAGLLPPSPPQPRSKRPETALFIQWCYDRLYGNAAAQVKPQPQLFAGLAQNKGIIAMRNAFLAYLAAHHASTSPSTSADEAARDAEQDTRPYTKTILAPIAVPGCGKTVLAVALSSLFNVGHVQSDDFKKKTGFLSAIEKHVRAHAADANYVVFADKNNHLLQHRDEVIQLGARLSQPAALPTGKKRRQVADVGRVRTVALAWELDTVPLNTLHRICASRIEARGDNHQTLVADADAASVSGLKSHEVVLWRFLEALQPFASSDAKGEGDEGYGDARFDEVIRLGVDMSVEENLRRVVNAMADKVGWEMPSDERLRDALDLAARWKVENKLISKSVPGSGADASKSSTDATMITPRYFGLAVELDVRQLLDSMLLTTDAVDEGILRFYTSMRDSNRLNRRPHITLVHHSSRSAPSTSSPNNADEKWSFYTTLLSQPLDHASSTSSPTGAHLVFNVSISNLLYEPDTLFTLPVDQITPPDIIHSRFHHLHYPPPPSPPWTPHITLATHPNIPPYEANRLVSQWISNTHHANVQVLNLPTQLTVQARVFAMS
ncbi:tRNA ligase [Mycosarcoma maydis]|uniref:tRNA ligase n=1 Tax=Mycosarcoma maydis TaxID=5270 RepID=A0A0D1E5L1_MYCMD|nr:tRNA ligase [Ustilago maydis 521]KIS70946.1 hypothetical protein UMAG_00871 [Ustilago maydis 521]|eukprot:XP_011386892.1 hypothetical protein UMAG_00871 [Ustilago maydis 521]